MRDCPRLKFNANKGTLMKKEFMQKAIDAALKGIKKMKGGPFGACIVRKGKVIAVAHNTVLESKNPICHAEINAISLATKKLKSHILKECVIYSTTEPCPMCFSAIHWAQIKKVVYGTRIPDVQKRGFNELQIPARTLKALSKSPLELRSGYMRPECLELLKTWDKLDKKQTY